MDTNPSQCFLTLKASVIQEPILHYPNLKKCHIAYKDASNEPCGAQLSQEHDGIEFPIAFLSHTFKLNGKGAPQNKKPTGNSEAASQKTYPITMKYYQWVKDEIEKLLTAKVI